MVEPSNDQVRPADAAQLTVEGDAKVQPTADDYIRRHSESLHTSLAAAVKSAISARAEQPLLHVTETLLTTVGGEADVVRLREEVASLRAELALMRRARETAEQAAGDAKGVQALNVALYKLGALQHEPPRFEWFDPVHLEGRAVLFKEIKLPFATQTHEVCFCPVCRCVFVTQMSNSVLVRIPVGRDGLLVDDQDAWRVGPTDPASGDGVSGLHNVSLSRRHPGCLWISLQYANLLMLVDGAKMAVRKVMKVPSLLRRADGSVGSVGGPHCVRECGATGKIWVALKGSVPCHPGEDLVTADTLAGRGGLRAALDRVCCNPRVLRQRMEALQQLGYDTPPPDAFAVWCVDPDKYEPSDFNGALGGELFECAPSPPMIAIDGACGAWVAQDRSPEILSIASDGATRRHAVRFCATDAPQITGPAIVTAPDGAVWCSLLGAHGSFLRIDPKSGTKEVYSIAYPGWVSSARFIHMAFTTLRHQTRVYPAAWSPTGRDIECEQEETMIMCAICSNLVDPEGVNALVILELDPSWKHIIASKWVPLPTQDSCIHRVEIINEGLPACDTSVVVTELASSKLWQMKLEHAHLNNSLVQRKEWRGDKGDAERTLVRHYVDAGDPNSRDIALGEEGNTAARLSDAEAGSNSTDEAYAKIVKLTGDMLKAGKKDPEASTQIISEWFEIMRGPPAFAELRDGKMFLKCTPTNLMEEAWGYDFT